MVKNNTRLLFFMVAWFYISSNVKCQTNVQLLLQNIDFPVSNCSADQFVDITLTTRNAEYEGYLYVRYEVYLSPTRNASSGQLYWVGIIDRYANLSPLETFNMTSKYLRVPRVLPGKYYIVVSRANDDFEEIPPEHREDTAVYKTVTEYSIEVLVANLDVIQFENPTIGSPGEMISISLLLQNTGNGTAYSSNHYNMRSIFYIQSVNSTNELTYFGEHNFEMEVGVKVNEILNMTSIFRIPNVPSGKYHLIFKHDVGFNIWEGSEDVDKFTRSKMLITIKSAELVVSSGIIPEVGAPDEKVSISVMIKNIGNITAFPSDDSSFHVTLYLTNSHVTDPLYFAFVDYYDIIKANEEVNATRVNAIPRVPEGEYSVLVKINKGRYSETPRKDENMTMLKNRITVLVANLEVESLDIPRYVSPDELVSLTATIKNIGHGTAYSRYDMTTIFYLSLSNTTSSSMRIGQIFYESAVISNSRKNISDNFYIPKLPPGEYNIVVDLDPYNRVYQGDIGKDIQVFKNALTILAVDLIAYSFSFPENSTSGETVPMTFTMQNSGNGTAFTRYSSILNRVSLRHKITNDSFSAGGFYVSIGKAIQPGHKINASGVLTIPDVAPGDYNILLVLDVYKRVYEAPNAKNNNEVVTKEIISVLYVDLLLEKVYFPSLTSSAPGEPVTITWTVKNVGNATLQRNWYDTIYSSKNFSEPKRYWNDLYGTVHHGGLVIGERYNVTATFSLPNVQGDFYLGVFTDTYDYIYEHESKENNFKIFTKVTSVFADLQGILLKGPRSCSPGESIDLYWEVKNFGAGAAHSSYQYWNDRVFFARNVSDQSSYYSISSHTYRSSLLSQHQYNISQTATIPWQVTGGEYFIVLKVDDWGNVHENNKENNIFVSQAKVKIIQSDLQIAAFNTTYEVTGGSVFTITWSIINKGEGVAISSSLYMALHMYQNETTSEKLQTWSRSWYSIEIHPNQTKNETWSFAITNFVSGVYYISLEVDSYNQIPEENEDNNESAKRAINMNAAINPKNNSKDIVAKPQFKWPKYPKTQYSYLLVWMHGGNKNATLSVKVYGYYNTLMDILPQNSTIYWQIIYYLQSGEKIPGQVLQFHTSKQADFVPVSVVFPDFVFTGQPMQLNWTVRNQGLHQSIGRSYWQDHFYFYKVESLHSYSFSDAFGVQAGDISPQGYYHENRTFDVPHYLTPGKYVVKVCINNNWRYRVDEWTLENNCLFSDKNFTLYLSDQPDLQVNSVMVPSNSLSGKKVEVRWTVKNHGIVKTSATWSDGIYWSQNFTTDRYPKFLTRVQHTGVLEPNEEYSVVHDVEIPNFVSGPFYIGVKADMYNHIVENDKEDNNMNISNVIEVQLTPPPDLRVISIEAPEAGFAGEQIRVNWTVKNFGIGKTIETYWSDILYWSSDFDNDNSPKYIGSKSQWNKELGSLQSYNVSLLIELPRYQTGTYYIAVNADAYNRVFEDGLDDNNRLVSKPIRLIANVLPSNGDINVAIQPLFEWPIYANTIYHYIYVWKFGDSKGEGIKTYSNRYKPSVKYPSNSQMVWSIEYILKEGHSIDNQNVIKSPLWKFTTIKLPDFIIMNVNGPTLAYTGRSIQISWQVKNNGTGANKQVTWYDQVYLSKHMDGSSRFLYQSVRRQGIHMPNDIYTARTTLKIPNDMSFGNYYAFVRVNSYRYVDEEFLDNNAMSSSQVTTVKLTPPPDLKVVSISVPSITLSGKSIEIRWTVKNIGHGITSTSKGWYDKVEWSNNFTTDSRPLWLANIYHDGALQPEESYEVITTVKIPKYISGQYFISIVTDSYGHVFEYVNEENNRNISAPISVLLSPPPDLKVVNITAPKSVVTQQTVKVSYIVENKGQSDGSRLWWYDEIKVRSVDDSLSRQNAIVLSASHSGALDNADHYTKEVSFKVPEEWKSGNYSIQVTCDSRGRVFEANYTSNNVHSVMFRVEQKLPDLTVNAFNVDVYTNLTTGSTVFKLTISIENEGNADIEMFSDKLDIEYDNKQHDRIITKNHKQLLEYGSMVTYTKRVALKRVRSKSAKLTFVTNYLGEIYESKIANNKFVLHKLNLPEVYDNVTVDIIGFVNSQTNETIKEPTAGTQVNISIKYENKRAIPTASNWIDKLYFEQSGKEYVLGSFTLHQLAKYEKRYASFLVVLPDHIFGDVNLKIDHDVENSLVIQSSQLITITKLFKISIKPSPDLRPVSVEFTHVSGNTELLAVKWSVRNFGNNMNSAQTWTDSIVLSYSSFDSFATGYVILYKQENKMKLQSMQLYSYDINVVLPTYLSSESYYLFVVTDVAYDISERNGEENNALVADNVFKKQEAPSPSFNVTISSISKSQLVAGESIVVTYKVINTGVQTKVSSWVDEILLTNAFNEPPISLKLVQRIGTLTSGGQYDEAIDVVIPTNLKHGDYRIMVNIDKKQKVLAMPMSVYSEQLNIKEAQKFDLMIQSNEKMITAFSGQPITIQYTVNNAGPGNLISSKPWYDSLYLSEDNTLDLFDRKLCTVEVQQNLHGNISYTNSFVCNLPFLLYKDEYILILKNDDSEHLHELDRSNNLYEIELAVKSGSLLSDLGVANVQSSEEVSYPGQFSVSWDIVNNGTEEVNGYKCDTAYVSTDQYWDIDDTEVSVQCGLLTIPGSQTASNSRSYSLSKAVPLVKQAEYYSLVRTRSNVIDLNLDNNEVSSFNTMKIKHTTIILEKIYKYLASPGKTVILYLHDVPSGETLVIFGSGNDEDGAIEIFIRHQDPPTTEEYDAYAGEFLKPKQTATLTNTKAGDYYITIQYTHLYDKNMDMEVLAKIAKFEITSVFPTTVPSYNGITTFKIEGTLLPDNYMLTFFSNSNEFDDFEAIQTYRYSSTLMYASINTQNLELGNRLSVKVLDKRTQKEINLIDVITITEKQIQQLVMNFDTSNFVRVGDDIELAINVQNSGGTDALAPMFFLDVTNDVDLKIVSKNHTVFSGNYIFLLHSLDGPAGVLPPGSVSRLEFSASQFTQQQARIPISINQLKIKEEIQHPYVDKKEEYRPMYFHDRRWDPVWNTFLSNVGTNTKTFSKRIYEVANFFSLLHQRTCIVDSMVKYELDRLDGFYVTDNIYRVNDLKAPGSNYPSLNIERYVSPKLSYRDIPGSYNGYGPFGKGWISPLWSMKLIDITVGYIVLERYGDFYSFQSNDYGLTYISADGLGEIHNNGSGSITFYQMDVEKVIIYEFDAKDFSLSQIRSEDDSSIVWLNKEKTSFKDNLDQEMTISYGTLGYIDQIRLLKRNTILKTINYKYDEINHFLISVEVDGSLKASYSYDMKLGTLTEVTRSDQSRTEYVYGNNGRYVGHRDFDETGVLFSSNLMDEISPGTYERKEYPQNTSTVFKFDIQGRLAYYKHEGTPGFLVVHEGNTKTSYLDDLMILKETYIPKERMNLLENSEGDFTKEYLAENGVSMTKLVDAKGNIFEAHYDGDVLLNNTYPDGLSEKYHYDENGFLSGVTKRSGDDVSFTHDDDGVLFEKRIGETSKTIFSYNDKKLLTKISNGESTIELQYDSLNRPVSVSYDGKRTLFYGYDVKGRRRSLADDTGNYNITYHYDALGRLVKVQQHAGSIPEELLHLDYEDGALKKRRNGDQTNVMYQYHQVTKKLSSMKIEDHNSKLLTSFSFTYDKFGKITAIDGNEQRWKFSYDSKAQLTSFMDSEDNSETEIVYDKTYNRKNIKSGSDQLFYDVNPMNQIKTAGDKTFSYDSNGNMIKIKDTASGSEHSFAFTAENKLNSSSDNSNSCYYQYDAMGNPRSKRCGDVTIEYLVDPFGKFGADILGQFNSNGESTYYYHAPNQGLICTQHSSDNKMRYYHYDHLGSTIMITTDGVITNSYQYDPFGNTMKKMEQIENEFLFIGRWGVRKLSNFNDIFVMRTRLYHAQYGRFMSLDSYGFSGKSVNLYAYVSNNPVSGVDPRGTIIPLLVLGGMAIGGITNTAIYALTTDKTGQDFWAGAAGAATSGVIGGGLAAIPGGGLIAGAAGGAVGGLAGNLVEQSLDRNDGISIGSAVESTLLSAATSLIPINIRGYKGKGYTGFGNKNNPMIRNMQFNRILRGLNQHGKHLWKKLTAGNAVSATVGKIYEGLKNLGQKAYDAGKKAMDALRDLAQRASDLAYDTAREFERKYEEFKRDAKDWINERLNDLAELGERTLDGIEDAFERAMDAASDAVDRAREAFRDWWERMRDGAREWWDDFWEWIRSRDPEKDTSQDVDVKNQNDIIGPTGYGDARFIPVTTLMKYKIRFENHVNATAPAQRVIITQQLDGDLDYRTFRIGQFGFSNLTFEPEKSAPVLQKKYNLVDSISAYVRVVAGVDVSTGVLTFVMETLDPKTGQQPDDPSIGFLPPNPLNGTDGQGYVTYTVKAKKDTAHLKIIDAEASIIFDQNEPINTPAIFNTIDRSSPKTNLSISGSNLNSTSLLQTISTHDDGSGISYVDIYKKSVTNSRRRRNTSPTITDLSEFEPLVENVKTSTVMLPLEAGGTYDLIVVATNNVGNKENISNAQVFTVTVDEGPITPEYTTVPPTTTKAISTDKQTTPNSNSDKETVCIEGHVMDIFCIDRGTLLDAPRIKTMENPELHSVHCLVDVDVCYMSGFHILAANPSGSPKYRSAYELDAAGNALVIELARKTGGKQKGCTSCVEDTGKISHGFRATFFGEKVDNGEGKVATLKVHNITTSPRLLMENAEDGCPTGIISPESSTVPPMTTKVVSTDKQTTADTGSDRQTTPNSSTDELTTPVPEPEMSTTPGLPPMTTKVVSTNKQTTADTGSDRQTTPNSSTDELTTPVPEPEMSTTPGLPPMTTKVVSTNKQTTADTGSDRQTTPNSSTDELTTPVPEPEMSTAPGLPPMTTKVVSTNKQTTADTGSDRQTTPNSSTDELTTPVPEPEMSTTPGLPPMTTKVVSTNKQTTADTGSDRQTTPNSSTDEITTPVPEPEMSTTPGLPPMTTKVVSTNKQTTADTGSDRQTTPNSSTDEFTTPSPEPEMSTTPGSDSNKKTTPGAGSNKQTTPGSRSIALSTNMLFIASMVFLTYRII